MYLCLEVHNISTSLQKLKKKVKIYYYNKWCSVNE